MKLMQRMLDECEIAMERGMKKLCKHYLMRIQIEESTEFNTQFRLEETAR